MPGRWLAIAAAAVIAIAAGGCGVRSKVIVTSEPDGADVTMNGVNLGKTPVEAPFTWYWYYDFIAAKDGFQTVGVRRRFREPFYLFPPADLLMEAMPFPVRDTRRVNLVLRPVDERPPPEFTSGSVN